METPLQRLRKLVTCGGFLGMVVVPVDDLAALVSLAEAVADPITWAGTRNSATYLTTEDDD